MALTNFDLLSLSHRGEAGSDQQEIQLHPDDINTTIPQRILWAENDQK